MWRWNGKGLYPLTMTWTERESASEGLKRGERNVWNANITWMKRGEKREEDMKLKVTSGVLCGNEKGFVGKAERRKREKC